MKRHLCGILAVGSSLALSLGMPRLPVDLYLPLFLLCAFAGYGATSFSASLGTVAMLLGRFVPLLAALALGGALAGKKTAPFSLGTFRTDGPTFVVLLVGVIILTAGLMVFPALTLGPIVEGLMH